MRVRSALLVVAALALGCATPSSTGSTTPDAGAEAAPTKAEKDRVACRKMCEMAGETEDNTGAVADCQAKCDAAVAAP